MRESERLRARLREIVQGCDGTTMEWHERMSATVADAIAALERAEARVAELERLVSMCVEFDASLPARRLEPTDGA